MGAGERLLPLLGEKKKLACAKKRRPDLTSQQKGLIWAWPSSCTRGGKRYLFEDRGEKEGGSFLRRHYGEKRRPRSRCFALRKKKKLSEEEEGELRSISSQKVRLLERQGELYRKAGRTLARLRRRCSRCSGRNQLLSSKGEKGKDPPRKGKGARGIKEDLNGRLGRDGLLRPGISRTKRSASPRVPTYPRKEKETFYQRESARVCDSRRL